MIHQIYVENQRFSRNLDLNVCPELTWCKGVWVLSGGRLRPLGQFLFYYSLKHVRCNPDVAPGLTSGGYEDRVDVITPTNKLFIRGRRILIPHGDIVDVITPTNILFRGGGGSWPLMKIKLMLLSQSTYWWWSWCDDDVMMMMVMMMMVMMKMIMIMIMIMAIVSVEQRPGWGEHVLIGERTTKIRTFCPLTRKWLKRLTLPHARCTSFRLDAVLQPICCVFTFHPVWIKLGCVWK